VTASFVTNTIWNNWDPVAAREESNNTRTTLSLLLRYGKISQNLLSKTRIGAV